ncbi:MAG: DUF1615 family protein [Chlorobium limicola]|nr:DUF1615 family protein [Chlorobium limicola]
MNLPAMIRETRIALFTLCALFFTFVLSGCSRNENSGLAEEQIEKLILVADPGLDSPDIWAKAIKESLQEIGVPVSKENACAVIAVIAQESGFKTVPKTPGMKKILHNRLKNAESNPIVRFIIESRLDQQAANGKTFRENIDSIESERDVELWYNEFIAADVTKPMLQVLNKDVDDLITTIGSMQISVKFAEHYSKKPENTGHNDIRKILYTCKGGVFYGAAYLLDYKHDYDDWKYVFADYNAGHYACRNVGFQNMLANLTRKKIVPDGDLLSYKDGRAALGSTYGILIDYLKEMGMAFKEEEVRKDFRKEKSYDFENTLSYKTISALHKSKFGNTIYAALPDIPLKSDKFSGKNLSTKWFAQRVKSRFNQCMRTKL